MKHLFVPYETALQLKAKEFNEPCLKMWNVTNFDEPWLGEKGETSVQVNAPLYQQVIDWFREKHKLHVEASWQTTNDEINHKVTYWSMISKEDDLGFDTKEYFGLNSYYEALDKAIEEAIKLI